MASPMLVLALPMAVELWERLPAQKRANQMHRKPPTEKLPHEEHEE